VSVDKISVVKYRSARGKFVAEHSPTKTHDLPFEKSVGRSTARFRFADKWSRGKPSKKSLGSEPMTSTIIQNQHLTAGNCFGLTSACRCRLKAETGRRRVMSWSLRLHCTFGLSKLLSEFRPKMVASLARRCEFGIGWLLAL
jgi:hypothetical protein